MLQILSRTSILRLYDEARKTLDPLAAREHVAGVMELELVAVEGAIQARESLQSAAEVAS